MHSACSTRDEQTRGDENSTLTTIFVSEIELCYYRVRVRERGEIFHALKAGWDENEYSANRNDKITEIKHSKVSKSLG